MLRKLLNLKLNQTLLPNVENNLNVNNKQVNNCSFRHFKACGTVPVESLYSSENLKKNRELKILQIKVALAYDEGRHVPNPNTVTPEEWEYLLSLPTEKSRQIQLEYLGRTQMRKQREQTRKEIRTEVASQLHDKRTQEIQNNGHIVYGLYKNTLFPKIFPQTTKRWANRRLIRATRHDLKLVFDCSYDDYMTKSDARSTGKQLGFCFAVNRKHRRPFDLHMCNVDTNGQTMRALEKHIPTMYNKSFPLNFHETCFTEIFPKENLVYLTPHANEVLDEFRPEDIYLIGGYVDKGFTEPISLAKAKHAGIRMARLPIEKYLKWGSGGKYLTLNQMCSILLDLRYTRDWNTALLHVPRRKLY